MTSASPFSRPAIAALSALLLMLRPGAAAQSVLLDDFESTAHWRPVVSEGAKLSIGQAAGKNGQAMVMSFDLRGVYGYVIARRNVDLQVPANYQFTFDMRADAPVNNFEFKLVDGQENVFWIKKLNFAYPTEWTRQRIKKRQITFAWGPAKGGEIRHVRAIEFVVSVATGGTGRVFIDNLRFEPIDDSAGARAKPAFTASSSRPGAAGRLAGSGSALSGWRSGGKRDSEWIRIDFGYVREVGGLMLEWDSVEYARRYAVELSEDGQEWQTVYAVTKGGGGRHPLLLREAEGRYLRLALAGSARGNRYWIKRLEVRGPEFSRSDNDFFRALAAESPRGRFPRYFSGEQTNWTVVGASGDTREALVSEDGQIEVDKLQFMVEPFLFLDNRLITWNDVSTLPGLLEDDLPIPSVVWKVRDMLTLEVQVVAGGTAGNSLLGIRYRLTPERTLQGARLFLAIRPFQVNPPWQFLNVEGGVSRIDSIAYRDGMVRVNSRMLIPMTAPSAFGATEFDQGEITGYLARGQVPAEREARDRTGFASGVLAYDLVLRAGEPVEVYVAVPFHAWSGSPTAAMSQGSAEAYYSMMLAQSARFWKESVNRVQLSLPPMARAVENTFRTTQAYIFINRDGPGIQPGSRSYERSWIRDGSLTCAALLRTGHTEEVRDFLDWYAKGQFPSGKIPCVIDARGPDPVPEHDSHGQFIYAILQYYLFTHDTTWLRGKFDAVVRTVRYVQSLRAERKTDVYRNGTPEQRALYGLVPESISHEGYWDVPRHSYWDDFFVLRGLKDATTIAEILGETNLAREFAAERDDMRSCLYASMRLAMKNTGVDYIPGCAELGDFDATSTAIGILPGGELGNIPEPELHTTFDRYYAFFQERAKGLRAWENYTPYEVRIIGAYVLMGQKERAYELLKFFHADQRPHAWNHWAEVVWRVPATPKFIGDMPHTWVGSDYLRSVRSMFLDERERDTALVVGGGIPEEWMRDPEGVSARNLPTLYGTVDLSFSLMENAAVVRVGGKVAVPPGGVRVVSPASRPIRHATVNGVRADVAGNEVLVRSVPAEIQLAY